VNKTFVNNNLGDVSWLHVDSGVAFKEVSVDVGEVFWDMLEQVWDEEFGGSNDVFKDGQRFIEELEDSDSLLLKVKLFRFFCREIEFQSLFSM